MWTTLVCSKYFIASKPNIHRSFRLLQGIYKVVTPLSHGFNNVVTPFNNVTKINNE